METIGAVILAAGGSTRLGEPKQLLRFREEVLVRRTARAALAADCSPVIIVVGDEYDHIEMELAGIPVQLCRNPLWRHGIGSSIRAGVEHALRDPAKSDALVFLVCDQPFVSPEILRKLIEARGQSRGRAAACTYADTVGVPAIFDRAHFPLLLALPNDCGAKSILTAFSGEIALVEFPAGVIDIDTPSDRQALLDRADLMRPAARLRVRQQSAARKQPPTKPA